MGANSSVQYINFEDIQECAMHQENERRIHLNEIKKTLLINTLPNDSQECLIQNTISIEDEEKIINTILKQNTMKHYIVYIYGKHSNDILCQIKYNQFIQLGFQSSNIYIYNGGLFEWLLLQDIYGYKEFPTTKKELDILKYKPTSEYQKKNIKLLTL